MNPEANDAVVIQRRVFGSSACGTRSSMVASSSRPTTTDDEEPGQDVIENARPQLHTDDRDGNTGRGMQHRSHAALRDLAPFRTRVAAEVFV